MEYLALLFLILLNGVFAMAEIAVVSSRKVRLHQWVKEGRAGARVALQLASEPGPFLSTIQVGITTIGILSGAFGEATIAEHLAEIFAGYPSLAPYSHGLAITIMVMVITYLSVVIGELVPKRLALHNPERIASALARPMRWLAIATSPLVKLFSLSSKGLLRLLGARASAEPPVTEEEIKVLIQQGTEAGVFEEFERKGVANIFRLDNLRTGAIMTPRLEIDYLDMQDDFETNRQKIIASAHSTLPVSEGGLDHIIGVIRSKDLLTTMLAGKPLDLPALVSRPLAVPEAASPVQLLETFQRAKSHLALVIDEHGDLQGLVTLNDILFAIVGDIPLPFTDETPQAVRREDGSWLVDGMLSTETFKDIFALDKLPEEDTGLYHTLGGFVMTQLECVPQVTDHFEWRGLRFEVVDMDGNRVDKVLVTDGRPAAQNDDYAL